MVDIVTRTGWDARPPTSVKRITVPTPELWLHHTATDQHGPGGVRAIQNFHMDTRGWSDIAYSFLVDDDGTIYEGRGPAVAGAHTHGHNTVSHAICVMGNYQNVHPTETSIRSVARLVRHGHQHGWWPERLTGGHRDVGSTSCPGRYLYARIDDINRLATAKETPVDAVILVDHTEGTPDAITGLQALFLRPDQKVGLVVNVAAAKKALAEGKRVYAVGRAARLVDGDTDLAGANRLDTAEQVLEQGKKGW